MTYSDDNAPGDYESFGKWSNAFEFIFDTFDTDQSAIQTGIGTTETQSPMDTGGNQCVESDIPSVRIRNVKTDVKGPPDATGTSEIIVNQSTTSFAVFSADNESSLDGKINYMREDSEGNSESYSVLPEGNVELTDIVFEFTGLTGMLPNAGAGVATYLPISVEFIDADGDKGTARLEVFSNVCRPIDYEFSLSQFVVEQGCVRAGGAPAEGTVLIPDILRQGANDIDADLDFDAIVDIAVRLDIAGTDYDTNGTPDFATGGKLSLDELSIQCNAPGCTYGEAVSSALDESILI